MEEFNQIRNNKYAFHTIILCLLLIIAIIVLYFYAIYLLKSQDINTHSKQNKHSPITHPVVASAPANVAINNISPLPTLSSILNISSTPSVTSPVSTTASISIYLQYIGIGANTGVGFKTNNNPKHKDKALTLQFYKIDDDPMTASPATTISDFVKFNPQTGSFDNPAISLSNVAQGDYKVYAKVNGYLRRYIGIRSLNTSNLNDLTGPTPQVLIAGDINNDNSINMLDYNELLNCFPVQGNIPSNCNYNSDINDSGNTTAIDWTIALDLLLSNFSRQYGD